MGPPYKIILHGRFMYRNHPFEHLYAYKSQQPSKRVSVIIYCHKMWLYISCFSLKAGCSWLYLRESPTNTTPFSSSPSIPDDNTYTQCSTCTSSTSHHCQLDRDISYLAGRYKALRINSVCHIRGKTTRHMQILPFIIYFLRGKTASIQEWKTHSWFIL